VDDPLRVNVVHGKKYLFHNLTGSLFRIAAQLNNFIKEFASRNAVARGEEVRKKKIGRKGSAVLQFKNQEEKFVCLKAIL
jgi:hypothetical protein